MVQRQIEGEHAALAGQIAHVELAAVRLRGTPADREAETEPAPILAVLLEGREELLAQPGR